MATHLYVLGLRLSGDIQFSQHRTASWLKSSSGAQGLTLPVSCTVYSTLAFFNTCHKHVRLFLYHAHSLLEISYIALVLVLVNDPRLQEVAFYCTWLICFKTYKLWLKNEQDLRMLVHYCNVRRAKF